MRPLSLMTTLALATVIGCVHDPRMRFPQLLPRHPEAERQASEYHDPFPDDTAGPSVSNRPLGFQQQRTSTRRAAELRGVHLLDPNSEMPPQSKAPARINRFRQAVTP